MVGFFTIRIRQSACYVSNEDMYSVRQRRRCGRARRLKFEFIARKELSAIIKTVSMQMRRSQYSPVTRPAPFPSCVRRTTPGPPLYPDQVRFHVYITQLGREFPTKHWQARSQTPFMCKYDLSLVLFYKYAPVMITLRMQIC
jgi:hypothetical protein